MKVLSLKQPFAELIVSGKKTIELRNWKTNFRGEFLIHASKKPDERAMKQFGFNELPLGVIIGKSKLIGIKHYANDKEHILDKEKHLADSSWGKFGFLLEESERIDPISAKGKLNFWDFANGENNN